MIFSCFRWGGLGLLVALAFLSACSSSPQTRPETAHFEGLLKKGQAYLNVGNPQMALVALRQAQELQPDHVEMLSQLGIAFDQMGQTGPALTVWRRAHAIKPENGVISHNFGVALMRQELLDEAEVAFQGALKDPQFKGQVETYYNLSLIQQRRGAFREMVVGLQNILQIDSNYIPAHQVLADHYRKMRRPDLEEGPLRNILSITPEDVVTLERLADLLLQSGQGRQALPLLERIQVVAADSEAAKRAKLKQRQISGSD